MDGNLGEVKAAILCEGLSRELPSLFLQGFVNSLIIIIKDLVSSVLLCLVGCHGYWTKVIFPKL